MQTGVLLRAGVVAALTVLQVAAPGQGQPNEPGHQAPELHLARIRELYHLTDVIGEKLWPGFDTRRIPIAVNHLDQQELLAGHRSPPDEFEDFADIDGVAVLRREGSTRYGPRGGGWAVDLGGAKTAYVSTMREGEPTEQWLSLLLHECFHCYQDEYRQRSEGPWEEPPEDDPLYGAMIGLESRVLHAALSTNDESKIRELARMFVSVRHARREGRSAGLLRNEGESEYSEGTATYVQARMMEVLSRELALVPVSDKDPQYHAFGDADERHQRMLDRLLPRKVLITFFHSMYQNGMAQCLLLDRVRPRWKHEIKEKGMTQFALLERQFPLDEDSEAKLLTAARERFEYEPLLAEQTRLVAERIAVVRSYLEAPGRRYRIHHGDIRGRFNWKPAGPVYHVPRSLLPGGKYERVTIWAGGIANFEKGELTFRGKPVPVIFRQNYLEWVDPDPAQDGSDLVIESERIDNGVHHGLTVRTDGFVLEVPKGRIEKKESMVEIFPISGGG